MLYRDGKNYIKPNGALVSESQGAYLCDTFSIKLVWASDTKYPYAYEVGGRIVTTAKRLGKDPLDLHLLTGKQENALCLASPMELRAEFYDVFSLQKYLEEFLIPYLFGQTYYEKNERWPWPELSHGYPGHLEWLGRHPAPSQLDIWRTAVQTASLLGSNEVHALFSARCRPHHPCFCGSAKRTSVCHPAGQGGLVLIRGAISRRQFNISDILHDEA